MTRRRRGEFLLRETEDCFVARILNHSNRLSLRMRDAPIGAAALGSIVSGALMIPVAESFGEQKAPASRTLAIVILLFAPAMLGIIDSLIVERSKVYGSFGLVPAGIVLPLLPFAWYWLGMYLPFACAFTAFCAVVRVLEHRRKR